MQILNPTPCWVVAGRARLALNREEDSEPERKCLKENPWKGERAVLVAYTVNTLGKELEHECQGLEALGFPLPASVRLPLTEQQDVRCLDAFDCFEEEPLQEVEARHPDGKTSGLACECAKRRRLERNPST